MFKNESSYNLKQFMKMNDRCPACAQYLEIEPGFYYGTAYISYAMTVALSVATFVGWWLLVGFSLYGNNVIKMACAQCDCARGSTALPHALVARSLAVVFCHVQC